MSTVGQTTISILDYANLPTIMPFLLLFAVVFGILENRKMISEKRNINLLIALFATAIGMMSPVGAGLRSFAGTFIAMTYGWGMAIFGIMIMMTFWRAMREYQGKDTDMGGFESWVFWIAVAGVVVIFSTSGGLNLIGLSAAAPAFIIPPETIAWMGVIGLFVFTFVFLYYMATMEDRKKSREKKRREKELLELWAKHRHN